MSYFGKIWRRIAFPGLLVAACCHGPVLAQSTGEEDGGLWNDAGGDSQHSRDVGQR